MDVVEAEVIDGPAVLRCSLCDRPTADAGMVGKQCRTGAPPCRGRLIPARGSATGGEVARVATGVLVDRAPRADAADERPLSAAARELVMAGVPEATRKTYATAWSRYDSWCEEQGLESRPSAQSTMVEYLTHWETMPAHNRCAGGRQSDGEKCAGHRPAPSSMWIWYSAVRFYHSMPEPPFPWHGGKRLALAMKAYSERCVIAGWTPNKAPRAYPEHVTAMVDALDLDNPRHLMDRAVILTNWYTAGRASDLASYRVPDVQLTPRDLIQLTLRRSKTNKNVGRETDLRVVHPNNRHPQYDGVIALEAHKTKLRDLYGVTQGALFRPWTKPGASSGMPTLLRGHRDDLSYRMSSVSMSDIIAVAAVRAGIPDGEYFTCHSLRRGRATHLRELKADSLAIARAHGWADNGSLKEYLQEADLTSPESPTAMGLLG